MVAAVETMAYRNEVPWHGLGHHIGNTVNTKEMVELAGLDWSVSKVPLQAVTKPGQKNIEVPGFFALTRDTDKKVLDVVGRRYEPVQNTEAFEFFREFVDAGSAEMETAGSLRDGKMVWGLASLKQTFKIDKDDEVKGYLLLASPHEQGKSLLAKFTTVRVVCNNTLALALQEEGKKKKFTMAHRSKFDAAMIEKAKQTLGIARDQMTEFEKNAKALHELELKRDQVIKILAPIYSKTVEVKDLLTQKKFDENANKKFRTVMDVLENAPGAEVGTGWGVLNAVTYFSDHIASRTDDKRLSSAWFGKASREKEKVLVTLLDMVK
jgi:phage/plasmid-like protein (TIGR03299 family)